jgi:hypothetical protein
MDYIVRYFTLDKILWFEPITECIQLFIVSLVSSINTGVKLTKSYKCNLKQTQFQLEALHGLMLGDLHAARGKITHNTRLCFDQGKVHSAYALHLYTLFGSLINQSIYTTTRQPDSRTGVIYISMMFKTLAFLFLTFSVSYIIFLHLELIVLEYFLYP